MFCTDNFQNLRQKKAWRKKIPMATGVFSDGSGSMNIVWFNQPYIAKMISEGVPVKIEGKVSEKNGELYLSNPEVEHVPTLPTPGPLLGEKENSATTFPIYPESRGITSRWFYHTIQKIFNNGILNALKDPIPADILKRYNQQKFNI